MIINEPAHTQKSSTSSCQICNGTLTNLNKVLKWTHHVSYSIAHPTHCLSMKNVFFFFEKKSLAFWYFSNKTIWQAIQNSSQYLIQILHSTQKVYHTTISWVLSFEKFSISILTIVRLFIVLLFSHTIVCDEEWLYFV